MQTSSEVDSVTRTGPSELQLAQARFDRMYISADEIQRRLKINRCNISFAHQRGDLPQPIRAGGNTHIWERAVAEPFLVKWEAKIIALRAKRSKAK